MFGTLPSSSIIEHIQLAPRQAQSTSSGCACLLVFGSEFKFCTWAICPFVSSAHKHDVTKNEIHVFRPLIVRLEGPLSKSTQHYSRQGSFFVFVPSEFYSSSRCSKAAAEKRIPWQRAHWQTAHWQRAHRRACYPPDSLFPIVLFFQFVFTQVCHGIRSSTLVPAPSS